MNKEAIYHQSNIPFVYARGKQQMHIRIRTKKNDVQEITFIYGDPYDWHGDMWNYTTEQMEKSGTTELYDYWSIDVNLPFKRMRYAFKCQNNEDTLFYTERGIVDMIPRDISYFFCFPFIHEIDQFQAPKWVKDTIWYQIFPERFANGDASTNPPNTLPWGSSPPTSTNFFGGDFQGIIDRLDYLVDLGINGIYLTPICKAFSNHKYDTIDYFEIDPQFGDKKTFQSFMKACHKRGIKVMLDAVFNHSGFYFAPFQDVLEHGEESLYRDWFHIQEFPIQTNPFPNYDTFAFGASMPKLNTANPAVKDYLLKVATYWIEAFNIDGWRLDVANEIDHSFWREFRQTVKAIKPDIYILGEVWHNAQPWLQGDQFDAVMNYPFTNHVLDFFAKDIINAQQFSNRMTEVLHMYTKPVNEVAFNIIDSHDTPRILTVAHNRLERVTFIYLFQFLFTGTPCIYYGDEIGMKGEHDPGCRSCMIWDETKQNHTLLQFIKELISFRKNIPVLTNSDKTTFIPTSHNQVIRFERSNRDETIQIIINISKKDKPFSMILNKFDTEWIYNGEQFIQKEVQQRQLTEIKANSFKIYYIKNANK